LSRQKQEKGFTIFGYPYQTISQIVEGIMGSIGITEVYHIANPYSPDLPVGALRAFYICKNIRLL
jgi:hypothetical protein